MADNSYPKTLRLLSARDFSNLKVDSKLFKKSLLRIYFKPNNLTNSRLGISVSTRVAKSNIRNRFKRILREEFRLSDFRNKGVDILCVVQTYRKDTDILKIEYLLRKQLQEFIKTQE